MSVQDVVFAASPDGAHVAALRGDRLAVYAVEPVGEVARVTLSAPPAAPVLAFAGAHLVVHDGVRLEAFTVPQLARVGQVAVPPRLLAAAGTYVLIGGRDTASVVTLAGGLSAMPLRVPTPAAYAVGLDGGVGPQFLIWPPGAKAEVWDAATRVRRAQVALALPADVRQVGATTRPRSVWISRAAEIFVHRLSDGRTTAIALPGAPGPFAWHLRANWLVADIDGEAYAINTVFLSCAPAGVPAGAPRVLVPGPGATAWLFHDEAGELRRRAIGADRDAAGRDTAVRGGLSISLTAASPPRPAPPSAPAPPSPRANRPRISLTKTREVASSAPVATPHTALASGDELELRLARAYALVLRASAREAGDAAGVEQHARELDALDGELGARASGSPMTRLAQAMGLSAIEIDFVWAAVACTHDPRLGGHLRALVGPEARRGLSPSTYAAVFRPGDPRVVDLARDLSPAHPLLRGRLLENADGRASAIFAPLVPSRALVAYLSGRAWSTRFVEPIAVDVPLVHDHAQLQALDRVRHAMTAGDPMALVLEGPLGAGRRTAIACVGAELGYTTIALDLRRVPPGPASLRAALGELRQQVALTRALPIIADLGELEDGERGDEARRELGRFVDELGGVVALTTTRTAAVDLGARAPLVRVRWPLPDHATRVALWRSQLDADAGADAVTRGIEVEAVARYRLGAGDIARAVASARAGRDASGAALDARALVEGVRATIDERLGGLAQRVEVQHTWDDLVLAPDVLEQIRALVARVRYAHDVYDGWSFRTKVARGMGVPALFSGPPGTGKAMVAGLIAKELELELYRVDVSKVVSERVGETEQHIARVFDAAGAGSALLLFDRCGGLDGSALLRRLETFGGVTILTTGVDARVDAALERRLATHVVFGLPDEGERVRLWRRLLDTGAAPLAGDIDYTELAREFPAMSGAHIRNAVLAAAFLAVGEGAHLTHAHLVRAARAERRAMERIVG